MTYRTYKKSVRNAYVEISQAVENSIEEYEISKGRGSVTRKVERDIIKDVVPEWFRMAIINRKLNQEEIAELKVLVKKQYNIVIERSDLPKFMRI